MIWLALLRSLKLIFAFLHLCTRSPHEKELEILLLRRQLAIMQRHNRKIVCPQRADKFLLALLTLQFKQITQYTAKQLRDVVSIVLPETVLRWHRELVRRKWTQKKGAPGGRPPTAPELEALIIRLARENPWGYGKIVGELRKLGYHVSDQTIANILKRYGIPPLPHRQTSPSWKQPMTH